MAEIEFKIRSYIEKPADPEVDQELVYKFREQMAGAISRFGATGYTGGSTRFESIDDVSTFNLNLPVPGDLALQWVEVILAVEMIENIARELWNQLVPGLNVIVEVLEVSVEGRLVRSRSPGSRWPRFRPFKSPAPRRPGLSLALLLGGLALGFFGGRVSLPPTPPAASQSEAPLEVHVTVSSHPPAPPAAVTVVTPIIGPPPTPPCEDCPVIRRIEPTRQR